MVKFYRYFLSLLLLLPLSMQAAATDYGELELDKEYDYVLFSDVKGHYTCTQDGVLTFTSSNSDFCTPFTDEACTQTLSYTILFDESYHAYYNLQVTAGQVIYFHKSFSMNKGTFKVSFATSASLQLSSVTPAEGSTFVLGGEPQVVFNFNSAVKIGGAEVQVKNEVRSLTAQLGSNTVMLMPKDVLNALFTEGLMVTGDEITMRLKNVRMASDQSVVYGTDGTVEVKYVCGNKPVALTGTTNLLWPSSFKSYYMSNDLTGVCTMTFDGDLAQPTDPEESKVVLSYGNVEGNEGEYYNEVLPYTVEGNTLKFDLRGKRRSRKDLTLSGADYGNMSIKVCGVKSADGQYTYTNQSGQLGSYSYDMVFSDITANITTEFTPASGSSLEGVSEIELWMTDYAMVNFDGILFTYDENGQTKTYEQTTFKRVADADVQGAGIITFAVPAAVASKKNVRVSLMNVEVADGYDHATALTATYNGFILKKVTYQETPEAVAINLNGASLQQLTAEAVISVSTNMNDAIGYMVYQINDLSTDNPDEMVLKTRSTLFKQDDGTFQAVVNGINYRLLKGHTYRLVATAYASEDDYNYDNAPLGTAYVEFEGLTLPFTFSHTQFVSADPANGSDIADFDNLTITLNYDGMVLLDSETTRIVYGMGSTLPLSSLEAVEPDDMGLSNVWKLGINKATLASVGDNLTLSVVATDYDGNLVEGNTGEEENSYLMLTYTLLFNIPDLTVTPADGSEVKSLSQIVVEQKEKGLNEAYTGEAIIVYDAQNQEVARVVSVEPVIPADEEDNWDYVPQQQILTLNNELTATGTYTIVIPQGFFILGTEFDQHSSKRTVVTFRIDPLAAIGHISTDSTLADDTVYTLSGQKLGSRATLRQLPAGVYVIGGRKVVVR